MENCLDGQVVGLYAYNAQNILFVLGSIAYTLGRANPFRYRGYYYDIDTEFYYLQSRYYDPEVGRFLNADGYVSTGQGILSANMFAYCGNNPVMCVDPNGQSGIIYNFVIKVVNTIWRRLSMMSKIAKIRTQMEEEKESEPEVSMPPIMYVSQRPGKEGFIEEDWGGNDPRDGCAVACTSMALSSLGIYMTPEEIIKNNGGIVLMCWRKSGSYIKVASIDEALHNYRSNPQKYAPPIVNVKPTGASSMHFAVIIGGGNGVYTTYDPYHGINTIYNITGSNRIIQYYIR